jgi:phage gpG-like protein
VEYHIIDFNDSIAHVAERLELSSRDALNVQPAFFRIVEDMFDIERKIFSSQGRRGGGAWKKLKPDTIRRKGHSLILQKTGTLEHSLTVPGAPYQILNVTDSEIEFGSDMEIAAIHSAGAPSRGIPSRPVVKFTLGDFERWNKMLLNHITRSLRNNADL